MYVKLQKFEDKYQITYKYKHDGNVKTAVLECNTLEHAKDVIGILFSEKDKDDEKTSDTEEFIQSDDDEKTSDKVDVKSKEYSDRGDELTRRGYVIPSLLKTSNTE